MIGRKLLDVAVEVGVAHASGPVVGISDSDVLDIEQGSEADGQTVFHHPGVGCSEWSGDSFHGNIAAKVVVFCGIVVVIFFVSEDKILPRGSPVGTEALCTSLDLQTYRDYHGTSTCTLAFIFRLLARLA